MEKIKRNQCLAVIFFDFHLIALLGLTCFFVFEKKWPGLISYHLHPAFLLIFWLAALFLHSIFSENEKIGFIFVLAEILLMTLILIFYLKSLGPWQWIIILVILAIIMEIQRAKAKNKV